MPKGSPIPLLVAAVAILTVLITATTVIIVTGKLTPESTPAVTTILGFGGTVMAILLLAAQASQNASGIKDVQEKVNGHLGAHDQLVQKVDQIAEQTGNGPPPAPPSG